MDRRGFLISASASTLVALGDGAWFTYHGGHLLSSDDSAYSAWTRWSDDAEPKPLKLVRSAILASSPHNTQPWRFRVADSFIELYLEASRTVPGLDPYLREAHIGMGCALENLVLSAAANGFAATVAPASGALNLRQAEPQLRLVARVDLMPGTPRESELHDAIPRRHTNRSIYDPSRDLPSGFAAELLLVCNLNEDARLILFTDSAQLRDLTRTSAAANFELYSDPDVEKGSEDWIRWKSVDIRKFKDGLTIDTFGLPPFTAAIAKLSPTWLLKRAASPSHRSGLYEKQMQSASLIGIIAVRDRLETRNCLEAGRIWQRAHLFATARGVGARPCNETIEMIDHERMLGHPATCLSELTQVIRDPEYQPTFLFLMGYPTLPAHPSPRRPVESVEISRTGGKKTGEGVCTKATATNP